MVKLITVLVILILFIAGCNTGQTTTGGEAMHYRFDFDNTLSVFKELFDGNEERARRMTNDLRGTGVRGAIRAEWSEQPSILNLHSPPIIIETNDSRLLEIRREAPFFALVIVDIETGEVVYDHIGDDFIATSRHAFLLMDMENLDDYEMGRTFRVIMEVLDLDLEILGIDEDDMPLAEEIIYNYLRRESAAAEIMITGAISAEIVENINLPARFSDQVIVVRVRTENNHFYRVVFSARYLAIEVRCDTFDFDFENTIRVLLDVLNTLVEEEEFERVERNLRNSVHRRFSVSSGFGVRGAISAEIADRPDLLASGHDELVLRIVTEDNRLFLLVIGTLNSDTGPTVRRVIHATTGERVD